MSISQKKIISKDNCGSWVPSPFASSDGMGRRTARESLQREPRPVCLEGKKGRQEGKLVITTVISRLGSALYPPMTLPWAFESVMSGPALSSGSFYKEMQNWVWPFIFFCLKGLYRFFPAGPICFGVQSQKGINQTSSECQRPNRAHCLFPSTEVLRSWPKFKDIFSLKEFTARQHSVDLWCH